MTILIAEDNDLNLRFMEMALKKLGYKAIGTQNGAEALERWRKGGIACILMDIQMPVMDGIEATRQIRKEEEGTGNRTPIIALTAYALKDGQQKLFDAGVDRCLVKPVRITELGGLLKELAGTAQ